ncbi:MAG: helix-turn-helix transcriptional regulator, partial [Bacteroidia bacterium]|nr:helix-turn-helix transcriptional regulator [Bacteroidia bacterium]
HLSDKEKTILVECIHKIQHEIQENIDEYSQHILVSSIELLLNYCSRFYGRQLITRSQVNKSVIARIEHILTAYFAENRAKEQGLPSVKFLADSVNLSASYLSDLLRKETGKNAQEHIHFYLIEEAKNSLMNTDKNISEIAFDLGFDYPQYFAKLFKQKTGRTPLEYRNLA